MSRTKVKYTKVAQVTNTQPGEFMIENRTYADDDSYDAVVIGRYRRQRGGLFQTSALINGVEVHVGDFETQSQAGHAARDAWRDAEGVEMLSLEDAAVVLSPDAKDPVAALKKRIARGSVKTVGQGKNTLVIMPTA